MIENHYSLNLSLNGKHYARVDFSPSLFEHEAQEKARVVTEAMKAMDPAFKGDLSHITCSGHDITF